jgi:pimeloyl-ACP methyl ester carboxylesterase
MSFFRFLLILAVMFSSCNRIQQAEVKKAPIDGVDIAYYMRGSGPPLVMIMGFRGTMAAWDPLLLKTLEKNYTLILFDNRGAGLSSDTEQDLTTIEQMAEDAVGLIQALGYPKAHILGWSMGARIALQIAIAHPEILNTLTLFSPNPGGKNQVPHKTEAYELLTTKQMTDEKLLSLIFPQTPEGREASSEYVRRITEAILSGSIPNDLTVSEKTVARQANALILWDENETTYDLLPQIKTPTLIAAGLSDNVEPPQNAHIIANRIPFAWAAYFPDAGHNFLSQRGEELGKLITVFIDINHKKNGLLTFQKP